MQSKLFAKICLLFLVSLFFANAIFAQQSKPVSKPLTPEDLRKMDKGKMRPPHGAVFEITYIEGVKGMCDAVLADGNGQTLDEFFLYEKLPLLVAIISEAKKFGLTEEAVGTNKALTTRFSDKQVPNFIVDVSKTGKQTHFYLTVKNQTQSITLDAGKIKRGDPEEKIFLDEILTKIQAVKPRENVIQ
jgi:hypothetical protein